LARSGMPVRQLPTAKCFMPSIVERSLFLIGFVREALWRACLLVCILLPLLLFVTPGGPSSASRLSDVTEEVSKFEKATNPQQGAGMYRLGQMIQPAQPVSIAAKQTDAAPGTNPLEAAIEKHKLELQSFRLAGRRREQANTLRSIGDLLYQSEQHGSSLNYYLQALRLTRAVGSQRQEVEILNSIGGACALLGRNQSAITLFHQARNLSQKISYRRGEAQAVAGLGEAYYNLSDNRVLPYLEEALNLWRALDDSRGQAKALRHLGYVHTDASNLPQALDYYNQALLLCRAGHDEQGEAQTINAIALVHTLLGEREDAIKDYNQAERMFRKIGNRHGLAMALNGEGNLYANLDLKHALDCHQEALGLCEAIGNLDGQIVSHRYLGECYRALGEASVADDVGNRYYDRAIDHFEQSLHLSHALGDDRIEAYCLQDIAGVYEFKGDRAEALKHYHQSLRLSAAVKDPRGQAFVLNRLGAIHSATKQTRKALAFFNQALPLARAAEDRENESLTLYNIARAKLDQGDLKSAVSAIETALGIIERLRGKVPGYNLRSSYSASVHEYHQLKIDLLMRQHKQDPGRGLDVQALEESEAARARSLLDMLNDVRGKIRVDISARLLEEEAQMRRDLNLKAERQMGLLSGAHTEDQAAETEREIRELTARYENVQMEIRRQSPHYAALVQPKPLSVDGMQQVLDAHTLLLEYKLGNEKSYLWAVMPTEVSSYELPGRAEIEKTARTVYSLLTANYPVSGETSEQYETRVRKANEQLPAEIAQLSNLLLSPVASKLENKRLLVVPDGILQYIPFQILRKPGISRSSGKVDATEDSRPLVLDHEIVNEPSASALALLIAETAARKRGSNAVAVFADPVFEIDDPRISSSRPNGEAVAREFQKTDSQRAFRDVGLAGEGHNIPRLPSSRQEAEAIISLTPWRSGFQAMGFEASRATAMTTDLSDYRIVHFATHGLLNNEHPELSGIVLSLFDEKGQAQEGFLRLHDIYNLKLPVDLVVLSACNTGLGKDVRGEGLIGLTRGFMYAGASSVVASLWKVDDEATGELMRLFYGYMLRDGLSPAAALRKAQVTMSHQKRWQSPYYWAGFVIQGQYTQTERIHRFPSPRLALWLLGAVVISAAAFYALKRRRNINV
jgi:CHAT domain-containing protein/tetratricopeptide (TPR) repeat protein